MCIQELEGYVAIFKAALKEWQSFKNTSPAHQLAVVSCLACCSFCDRMMVKHVCGTEPGYLESLEKLDFLKSKGLSKLRETLSKMNALVAPISERCDKMDKRVKKVVSD